MAAAGEGASTNRLRRHAQRSSHSLSSSSFPLDGGLFLPPAPREPLHHDSHDQLQFDPRVNQRIDSSRQSFPDHKFEFQHDRFESDFRDFKPSRGILIDHGQHGFGDDAFSFNGNFDSIKKTNVRKTENQLSSLLETAVKKNGFSHTQPQVPILRGNFPYEVIDSFKPVHSGNVPSRGIVNTHKENNSESIKLQIADQIQGFNSKIEPFNDDVLEGITNNPSSFNTKGEFLSSSSSHSNRSNDVTSGIAAKGNVSHILQQETQVRSPQRKRVKVSGFQGHEKHSGTPIDRSDAQYYDEYYVDEQNDDPTEEYINDYYQYYDEFKSQLQDENDGVKAEPSVLEEPTDADIFEEAVTEFTNKGHVDLLSELQENTEIKSGLLVPATTASSLSSSTSHRSPPQLTKTESQTELPLVLPDAAVLDGATTAATLIDESFDQNDRQAPEEKNAEMDTDVKKDENSKNETTADDNELLEYEDISTTEMSKREQEIAIAAEKHRQRLKEPPPKIGRGSFRHRLNLLKQKRLEASQTRVWTPTTPSRSDELPPSETTPTENENNPGFLNKSTNFRGIQELPQENAPDFYTRLKNRIFTSPAPATSREVAVLQEGAGTDEENAFPGRNTDSTGNVSNKDEYADRVNLSMVGRLNDLRNVFQKQRARNSSNKSSRSSTESPKPVRTPTGAQFTLKYKGDSVRIPVAITENFSDDTVVVSQKLNVNISQVKNSNLKASINNSILESNSKLEQNLDPANESQASILNFLNNLALYDLDGDTSNKNENEELISITSTSDDLKPAYIPSTLIEVEDPVSTTPVPILDTTSSTQLKTTENYGVSNSHFNISKPLETLTKLFLIDDIETTVEPIMPIVLKETTKPANIVVAESNETYANINSKNLNNQSPALPSTGKPQYNEETDTVQQINATTKITNISSARTLSTTSTTVTLSPILTTVPSPKIALSTTELPSAAAPLTTTTSSSTTELLTTMNTLSTIPETTEEYYIFTTNSQPPPRTPDALAMVTAPMTSRVTAAEKSVSTVPVTTPMSTTPTDRMSTAAFSLRMSQTTEEKFTISPDDLIPTELSLFDVMDPEVEQLNARVELKSTEKPSSAANIINDIMDDAPIIKITTDVPVILSDLIVHMRNNSMEVERTKKGQTSFSKIEHGDLNEPVIKTTITLFTDNVPQSDLSERKQKPIGRIGVVSPETESQTYLTSLQIKENKTVDSDNEIDALVNLKNSLRDFKNKSNNVASVEIFSTRPSVVVSNKPSNNFYFSNRNSPNIWEEENQHQVTDSSFSQSTVNIFTERPATTTTETSFVRLQQLLREFDHSNRPELSMTQFLGLDIETNDAGVSDSGHTNHLSSRTGSNPVSDRSNFGNHNIHHHRQANLHRNPQNLFTTAAVFNDAFDHLGDSSQQALTNNDNRIVDPRGRESFFSSNLDDLSLAASEGVSTESNLNQTEEVTTNNPEESTIAKVLIPLNDRDITNTSVNNNESSNIDTTTDVTTTETIASTMVTTEMSEVTTTDKPDELTTIFTSNDLTDEEMAVIANSNITIDDVEEFLNETTNSTFIEEALKRFPEIIEMTQGRLTSEVKNPDEVTNVTLQLKQFLLKQRDMDLGNVTEEEKESFTRSKDKFLSNDAVRERLRLLRIFKARKERQTGNSGIQKHFTKVKGATKVYQRTDDVNLENIGVRVNTRVKLRDILSKRHEEPEEVTEVAIEPTTITPPTSIRDQLIKLQNREKEKENTKPKFDNIVKVNGFTIIKEKEEQQTVYPNEALIFSQGTQQSVSQQFVPERVSTASFLPTVPPSDRFGNKISFETQQERSSSFGINTLVGNQNLHDQDLGSLSSRQPFVDATIQSPSGTFKVQGRNSGISSGNQNKIAGFGNLEDLLVRQSPRIESSSLAARLRNKMNSGFLPTVPPATNDLEIHTEEHPGRLNEGNNGVIDHHINEQIEPVFATTAPSTEKALNTESYDYGTTTFNAEPDFYYDYYDETTRTPPDLGYYDENDAVNTHSPETSSLSKILEPHQGQHSEDLDYLLNLNENSPVEESIIIGDFVKDEIDAFLTEENVNLHGATTERERETSYENLFPENDFAHTVTPEPDLFTVNEFHKDVTTIRNFGEVDAHRSISHNPPTPSFVSQSIPITHRRQGVRHIVSPPTVGGGVIRVSPPSAILRGTLSTPVTLQPAKATVTKAGQDHRSRATTPPERQSEHHAREAEHNNFGPLHHQSGIHPNAFNGRFNDLGPEEEQKRQELFFQRGQQGSRGSFTPPGNQAHNPHLHHQNHNLIHQHQLQVHQRAHESAILNHHQINHHQQIPAFFNEGPLNSHFEDRQVRGRSDVTGVSPEEDMETKDEKRRSSILAPLRTTTDHSISSKVQTSNNHFQIQVPIPHGNTSTAGGKGDNNFQSPFNEFVHNANRLFSDGRVNLSSNGANIQVHPRANTLGNHNFITTERALLSHTIPAVTPTTFRPRAGFAQFHQHHPVFKITPIPRQEHSAPSHHAQQRPQHRKTENNNANSNFDGTFNNNHHQQQHHTHRNPHPSITGQNIHVRQHGDGTTIDQRQSTFTTVKPFLPTTPRSTSIENGQQNRILVRPTVIEQSHPQSSIFKVFNDNSLPNNVHFNRVNQLEDTIQNVNFVTNTLLERLPKNPLSPTTPVSAHFDRIPADVHINSFIRVTSNPSIISPSSPDDQRSFITHSNQLLRHQQQSHHPTTLQPRQHVVDGIIRFTKEDVISAVNRDSIVNQRFNPSSAEQSLSSGRSNIKGNFLHDQSPSPNTENIWFPPQADQRPRSQFPPRKAESPEIKQGPPQSIHPSSKSQQRNSTVQFGLSTPKPGILLPLGKNGNPITSVTQLMEEGSIPGRAGVDYPVHRQLPSTATQFQCPTQEDEGSAGLLLPDVQFGCQMYHLCRAGARTSFLCPVGTIFNQLTQVCQWWFQVQCRRSSTVG